MSQPLTAEQLTEIRDYLEGCKGSERAEIPAHLRRYETWLGEADGRALLLLAEVDRLRALVGAEPARPSDGHSAVYIDQHGQGVWSDYPTVPPGDDVLPMAWASERTTSKEDLADQGVELRVVGWIK